MPPVPSVPDAPSCVAVMRHALERRRQRLIVYSVSLRSTSTSDPFSPETFSRGRTPSVSSTRCAATIPNSASHLRIESGS
jgi:hypothetical protein